MIDAPATTIAPEPVIDRLWKPLKPGARMYALVDAARDAQIAPALSALDSQSYRALLPGKLGQELAPAAPCLVRLDQTAPFTRTLVAQGWGQSWGIFLESSASLDDLLKHFQGLLLVKDAIGRPLHFRFYDPRVLRVYLPTCNETELGLVLGPVVRYCVESDDGMNLVEFPPKQGKSYPL